MGKDLVRLKNIYSKTDGYCHICYKKLSFKNHGISGSRGAWHIEHSKPSAHGGANHLNNLFPACISCNLKKGTLHTKTVRKGNNVTRAPLSRKKKIEIRNSNTTAGALIGGIFGATIGPAGAVIGATIGGMFGRNNSPKR